MNEWKPILLLAKKSLLVLGVVLLMSLTAVFGMRSVEDGFNTALLQLQAALQQQQTQLESKNTDLKNMENHITRYESLRAQGLVGEPDRAMWVEQMQVSRKSLKLPESFAVDLQAAKPLGGAETAPPEEGSPALPQMHDLQFELRDVHELEVLALVQDFRNHVKGRFRVQSCKLQEPNDAGLSVRCSLRFVTMPAMATTNTATTGVQP